MKEIAELLSVPLRCARCGRKLANPMAVGGLLYGRICARKLR